MDSWGVSEEWRKGPWTPEEDKLLIEYVSQNGEGRWTCVSNCAGLKRSGKSCRLRWVNYLRPGLKKGPMTPMEEGIIIELHALYGNKWSTIARYLPGRTDNEIKNYWRTHFKKRKATHEMEHENKRFVLQKLHEQEEEKLNEIKDSPESTNEAIVYPSIENYDFFFPIATQDDSSWSGYIPLSDSYLWEGLWNFDDKK